MHEHRLCFCVCMPLMCPFVASACVCVCHVRRHSHRRTLCTHARQASTCICYKQGACRRTSTDGDVGSCARAHALPAATWLPATPNWEPTQRASRQLTSASTSPPPLRRATAGRVGVDVWCHDTYPYRLASAVSKTELCFFTIWYRKGCPSILERQSRLDQTRSGLEFDPRRLTRFVNPDQTETHPLGKDA